MVSYHQPLATYHQPPPGCRVVVEVGQVLVARDVTSTCWVVVSAVICRTNPTTCEVILHPLDQEHHGKAMVKRGKATVKPGKTNQHGEFSYATAPGPTFSLW